MTSGSNEPVYDGGSEGHSIFAFYFLNELRNPLEKVFSVKELSLRVAQAVGNNSIQTPLSGTLRGAEDAGGQMIFIRK